MTGRPFLSFALFFASISAIAQQPTAPVEAAARAFIEKETRGLPGEVSIEVSPLDPGNRLPPCSEPTAFLPNSARAWGAFSVGVRCESPVAWTIYLQARVKVISDYLVVARPLTAGQIIGPAEIEHRRGDIAALPDDVLTDASQATGRPARQALAQGTPLRARMLRIPKAVRQGSTVTVFSRGEAFRVSNTGRALNSAAPGETVRVRLPNNQVITGTALHDGTIEVGP
ncbi:MAG: flagellar basal body P-ring formation protein FlgA [Azoarcus sp.]|jgi:flagella basal body P-ring formation protein FlgA|nr:flagellar basal body P-ring formation protein FlgA [Azoarcus sp.]